MEQIKSSDQKSTMNVFEFQVNNSASSCGYCKISNKKSKTSYKWGFATESLDAGMYEKLMFMGWRRCGDYLYKNDLSKSCCKLYTMRLDVNRFKISKTQRKVMKNFRKYISGKEIKNKNVENHMLVDDNNNYKSNTVKDKYEDLLITMLNEFVKSDEFIENMKKITEVNLEKIDFKVAPNKNIKFGDYSVNLAIVIYHKLKGNPEFSKLYHHPVEFYKFIKQLLDNYMNKNILKTWTTNLSEKSGHINFTISEREEYTKYKDELKQIQDNNNNKKINKKNTNKQVENNKEILEEKQYKLEYFEELSPQPNVLDKDIVHKYTLELEPTINITNEKFEIYKKYQKTIHKDKEEELKVERFQQSWGTSNLQGEVKYKTENKLYPIKYGTYDLIHRINGKIVAVGILDIMPTSVSSVYLYYDPDYSFLNLGVFTAIREIEYIKDLQKNLDENFKYYAMGFYCYTCQKMKYKGLYHPSEILCPVTHNFVDLDSVISLLEKNTFTKLSNDPIFNEVDLTKEEKDKISKSLVLNYQDRSYGLISFINSYVAKQYRKDLIESIDHIIDTIGKNNIKEFILTAN